MNTYNNPLIERYSSKEMLQIFSPDTKFSTWRKLWLALAESEKELGLNITDVQIQQMKENIYNIDYERANFFEKKLRHDVMAHVHTFGELCKEAMPIIHLGATSAFVGDNTDIIVMRDALKLILEKIAILMNNLAKFANEYKNLPTLGFTHFQPAQLTTVGKRACLWIQDLLIDYENIDFQIQNLKLRGVKGTTGTQASFLELFEGDHEKVKKLDKMIANAFDFQSTYSVTGQTYPRKLDANVLSLLSGVAQSLHKITNDLRLLQSLKEVEEPFEKTQIGSSAMAYKRNPMRSERISSLSKYIISLAQAPVLVSATQWFERTLDDSASKRLSIPEAFLALDAALDIANNVTSGLVVYDKIITKHVLEELPFMATENIIMDQVKKGGDRQELHEIIRVHSMEAGRNVKELGGVNDLVERLLNDTRLSLNKEELNLILKPNNFIGRAPEQVGEFLEEIQWVFDKHSNILDRTVDLKV